MDTDRAWRSSGGGRGRTPSPARANAAADGEPRAAGPGLARFTDRVEHKKPRNRPWLAIAAVLVALGAVGSTFGAVAVARNQGQQSRQGFAATAMAISSTFQLAIQHEQDLVIGAGAFVVRDPDASQADFVKWTSSVHAFERYPELMTSAICHGPGIALDEFRHLGGDPSGPLAGPDGTFRVEPPGHRAYYCFGTVGEVRNTEDRRTGGTGLLRHRTRTGASRGTGHAAGAPTSRSRSATTSNWRVELPTTRRRQSDHPSGPKKRIPRLVGVSIVPDVLLDRALLGYPDAIAVTMEVRPGYGSRGLHRRQAASAHRH